MTSMFNDPAFREKWQKAQLDDPDITLQDFLLIVNGQESEGLMTETRDEARQRRKLERRAARADLEASNDPFLMKILAKQKANPLPLKRTGCYVSYKIADKGNSYHNADNRIIRDSLTNISLC